MDNALPIPHQDANNLTRLGQFIRWSIITALFFSSIDLLMLTLTPGPAAALNVGADLLLIGALLLTRAQVRRSQLISAVWLVCGALWAFAVVLALTDPWIATAIAFLPLLAVIAVTPYVEQQTLKRLSWAGVVITVLTFVGATQFRLFSDPAPTGAEAQGIGALAATSGLIFFVLNQVHGRLGENLRETQRVNRALQQGKADLEAEVQARTAELRQLLVAERERSTEQARLIAEIAQQRATIRALSVPVIPVSAQVLVMPLVGVLDNERLEAFQQEALRAVERSRATVLILDITGMVLVDQLVAQRLLDVVQAARLLGVRSWLVGIRPEVAQTLIDLSIDLSDLQTKASLQDILPLVVGQSLSAPR